MERTITQNKQFELSHLNEEKRRKREESEQKAEIKREKKQNSEV